MSEIIRVAQITGDVVKGGIESVVYNYYKYIDKTKIQFDFIIHEDSPFEMPEEILGLGCKVFIVPRYSNPHKYINTLIDLFKRENYKIVHSHMSSLSVLTLMAAKRANVPVRISHCHGPGGKNVDEFFINIIRRTLSMLSTVYPTHLFACSDYSAKWMFGNKAFKQGKITIINNAVDNKKFAFNGYVRQKTRAKLGLGDKFVVGHVGRFVPQKNHQFLLDIFASIYKKENNSVLILVGDGRLKNKIKEKVNELNLQDNVLFLGGRSDVNKLYQAMDVFLMPSLYEGLPVVLVETQFARLNTIASIKVGEEAKFSDSIEFLQLKEKPEVWAEQVLSKKGMRRGSCIFYDNAKCYMVENEVKKLEGMYMSMVREEKINVVYDRMKLV